MELDTTSWLLPTTKFDDHSLQNPASSLVQNHKFWRCSWSQAEHWRAWGLCGSEAVGGDGRWQWRFGIEQIFDGWEIVYYSLIWKNVPHDCQQVSLHQLKQQIEVFSIAGSNHPLQFYYVLVAHLLQYLHLPVGALSVDAVSKSAEHFLEGIWLALVATLHLPDVAVGAAAHQFSDSEKLEDVGVDVFRHLN